MATKRKKTRKRASIRKYSAAPKRGRRIRRKKRGMLSEFFTAGTAREAAMNTANGAAGGAIALMIDRATPEQTPIKKAILLGAAAFVSGAVFKKPLMGAGIAGVAAYIALQNSNLFAPVTMADDWANDIEALPPFISDSSFDLADQYALAQDGEDINDILENSTMPEYAPQYNQTMMNY
jgi:hypothetical protein